MPETTTLNMLRTGELGIIRKIKQRSRFKRRLVEMGFLPDTQIKVIKFAPMRDPAEYALCGYHVSIRRKEAADIVVDKV